jgi:hypothetical protein
MKDVVWAWLENNDGADQDDDNATLSNATKLNLLAIADDGTLTLYSIVDVSMTHRIIVSSNFSFSEIFFFCCCYFLSLHTQFLDDQNKMPDELDVIDRLWIDVVLPVLSVASFNQSESVIIC